MQHACTEPADEDPGEAASGPEPITNLLNPHSEIGSFKTMLDMIVSRRPVLCAKVRLMRTQQMLNMLGGQERTLNGFKELGAAAGWKFESVKHDLISAFVFSPM